MSTAVPAVDPARAPLLARAYLTGDPPSPLAGLLAHVPELLEAVMPFIATVYGPSALPDRLKEIVVLRTSARSGCRYCTRVHGDLAREAGLDRAEVAALRALAEPAAAFGGAEDRLERAAVAFADAMCERPAGAVALLQPHFRADHIVELTVLAGATSFLNRFCTAMGLT